MALFREKVVAIVPASLLPEDQADEPLEVLPALAPWVRGSLLGIVLGLVLVFTIAAWLSPYEADGSPRAMGTHQQLGLLPCSFLFITGVPCPSCGMTTSFALLVRGDLRNSLQANAVGTLLAVFCLLLIPWGVVSVYLGRPLFVVSLEMALLRCLAVFVGLMLLRWVIVLAWIFTGRGT